MTDASAPPNTPWHLWLVGGLSLLWNSYGCYDYTMTELRNPAYLANLPANVVAYINAMPPWLIAFWALGVWGSLAGSLLLLLRSRYATLAFAGSLLGLVASQVVQTLGHAPTGLDKAGNLPMVLVIWGVLVLLLWYAFAQRRRGVLR